VEFIRIDGSTPPQVRAAHVGRFQSRAACRVALLSIKAAGAGLTLTVRLQVSPHLAQCTTIEAACILARAGERQCLP
jgi:hypothetical protein